MSMTDSGGWLGEFVESGSGEAFGKLVAAHFDLVFSAARRRVGGDAHLAQDVAQQVFTDLARKAGSLPRGVYLAGWLYRHTCFTAAKAVRGERRRQNREREAMAMNLQNENEPGDAVWEQLAPVLEEAMRELGEADRDAILLRFFERRTFKGVGETLGTSEDGARKRVERALEKLRGYFGRRGVAVSAVTLGEVLNAQAVVTGPAGAAASVASAALAGAAVGGGVGGVSTILKLLVMTKLKIAGVVVAAALAGVIMQQALTNQKLREENRALAEAASQVDGLRAENERLGKTQTNAGGTMGEEQLKDLLRLRAQVGTMKQELAVAQKTMALNERAAADRRPAKEQDEEMDPQRQLAIAKLNYSREYCLAALSYANDHNGQMPAGFEQAASYGLTNYAKGTIYLTPDLFEVVFSGTAQDLKGAQTAETLLLREKLPVPTTDGGWTKAYAFLDGHSEIHKEKDFRNFEAWENARMVK